jgi:ADP-ribose pyrophosphatase YjhB (NUDIX family)
MVKLVYGTRIARSATLRVTALGAVFDAQGRVLLTKRADDGHWCFPGGVMEPGESVKEACERELIEETGLEVKADRLIAVYSNPDFICEYGDGNRWHNVELFFECRTVGGTLGISDETTEARYFARDEIGPLTLHQPDRDRVLDAFMRNAPVVVR